MRIPKSFNLAGLTINVKFDDKLLHVDDNLGQARYRENLVLLQKRSKDNPILKENQEQHFLHEKIHWILNIMNEHDLRNNEKFVDTFAHLLYQSIKSEKY